jgi:hypothetical protein
VPAVPHFDAEYFISRNWALQIAGKPALPCGGVANILTVAGNECGSYLIYESDEHGFHNPKGLYTAGHVDIVMVGDSFTHGSYVKSDENVAAILRAKYGHVLNLGRGGNGPLAELASLVEYGVHLKPKKVFWCYFEGNDLLDLVNERKTLLIHYLERGYSNNLIEHQQEIDYALNSFIEKELSKSDVPIGGLEFFPALCRVRRIVLTSYLIGQSHNQFVSQSQLALFKEILHTAKGHTENCGGQLYFVYLPQFERYAGKMFDEGLYHAVKETVEELEIPFIDVRKTFDNHPDPSSLFPFRVRGHYTAEGYRLVADTIIKEIGSSTD